MDRMVTESVARQCADAFMLADEKAAARVLARCVDQLVLDDEERDAIVRRYQQIICRIH